MAKVVLHKFLPCDREQHEHCSEQHHYGGFDWQCDCFCHGRLPYSQRGLATATREAFEDRSHLATNADVISANIIDGAEWHRRPERPETVIVPFFTVLPRCKDGDHRNCHLAYYSDGVSNVCMCDCHAHGLLLAKFQVWNHEWLLDWSGLAPKVVRRRGGLQVKAKAAVFYLSRKCDSGDHWNCIEIFELANEQWLCDCDCHVRNQFGCIGAMGHSWRVRQAIFRKGKGSNR
jgi:hypothetical protein